MKMSEIERLFETARTFTDTIDAVPPKPVGTLRINASFVMAIYGEMPSWFHRWMAKILLGWKYEKEGSHERKHP